MEHPCPICGKSLMDGKLAYEKATRTIIHADCLIRAATVKDDLRSNDTEKPSP